LPDLRPLGQIQESFIIAAGRDGLWIIDQHVAHERILFEKVLRQQAENRVESQHLLMPIVIELTAAQQIEYARIADELNRSGFDTEPFGNRTTAVKAAPSGVGLADIEKLICEILEISEGELRKVSLEDMRRAMAATIACRAAIQSHQINGEASEPVSAFVMLTGNRSQTGVRVPLRQRSKRRCA
jgi:DNA mismatch repair protein MutL